jgi:hypothetical protein
MSLARSSCVALFVLAACGGSVSSSTLATGPATLDNSTVGSYGSFVSLASRMGAGTRFGPFLNVTPAGAMQQHGCLSGDATFTLGAATGPVTGSVSFAGFDNCYFLALNGTAAITGTLAGIAHVDSFTLTFSNLAYSATGSSDIFRASGTLVIAWKPSFQGSAGYLMTLDATVTDASQKTLFRLDGFRIDSDVTAGIESMLVSGRVTTDRGFVDVSSTNRLDLAFPSHGFSNGSLSLTGSTQVATLTFSGDGTFTAQFHPKG